MHACRRDTMRAMHVKRHDARDVAFAVASRLR